MKKLHTVFALGIAGLLLTAAAPANALTLVPECARVKSIEPASVQCAIETAENVARFIIGITGSLALLMFVYGGFTMLTANGMEDKVKKGKEIIRNAVIGIVLIVSAFYIVDYFAASLKGGEQHTAGETCLSGQGRYVETSGGNVECRYTCQSQPGYFCTSEPEGKQNCNDYLCSSATQTCCTEN